MPLLSVVIPSHRRADLLRACLRSLQTHAPADTEIIVCDDGSPAGLVSATAALFPEVLCLRTDTAHGFARTVNAGMAHARADIVQVLNDDTTVTAGWTVGPLSAFADAAVGSVAPLVMQHARPTHIDSAGDEFDPGGFARKRGHGQRLTNALRTPAEVFGASGSSAFYRRSAFQNVGGYADDFGAYFEDVDLAVRLRRAGWRCRYEPSSVVTHRIGGSYRPGPALARLQSRNEERLFLRHIAPHGWGRHTAVLAGKALLRCRDGLLLPWLIGRVDAWRESVG